MRAKRIEAEESGAGLSFPRAGLVVFWPAIRAAAPMNELTSTDCGHLRGLDSNTLLRLYDDATRAPRPANKERRAKLENYLDRIARELARRNESIPRATIGAPLVLRPQPR